MRKQMLRLNRKKTNRTYSCSTSSPTLRCSCWDCRTCAWSLRPAMQYLQWIERSEQYKTTVRAFQSTAQRIEIHKYIILCTVGPALVKCKLIVNRTRCNQPIYTKCRKESTQARNNDHERVVQQWWCPFPQILCTKTKVMDEYSTLHTAARYCTTAQP